MLALATLATFACNGGATKAGSEAASRGRAVWMARCTTCHNADPAKPGVLGPAVQGASRELVEARVLRAAYPAGYRPKRTTTLMVAMPDLAASIDDLTAFLAQSAEP